MVKGYHTPTTVQEAIALTDQLADPALFLAGGTEVNSAAFPGTPEHVISLERLPLADIRITGSELLIGARCTVQQIIDSADVPESVKAAGRHISNRNIRNVATIGGQLGSNRSCGNLLPVLVALEAIVDLATKNGTTAIPALHYITEERRELITQVRIRTSSPDRFVALERYARTANDLSILTVAVSLAREGTCVVKPVIAAGGVAKHVTRLGAVEKALDGKPLPSRDAIERLVAGHVSPIADIRGSIEFKRHLAGVLVAKAVIRAYGHEGERRP